MTAVPGVATIDPFTLHFRGSFGRFATNTASIPLRSEARHTISLMRRGHESASTHILIPDGSAVQSASPFDDVTADSRGHECRGPAG